MIRAIVLALLPIGAGRALAQDPAAAEALFRDGKKAMQTGDLAAACPKLAESYRLDPATGALMALALCYERQGRLASAWTAYADVVTRAKAEKNGKRERAAKAKVAELEKKLAYLVVTAADPSIPGLTITRAGVAIGASSLGVRLPIDPGEHSIEASAPGRVPHRATITVGAKGDHPLEIPALEIVPPPPPPPAPPPPVVTIALEEPSFFTPLRIAGVAAAGVGAVGIALGIGFSVRALDLKGRSNEDCDAESFCGPQGKQDRIDARRAGDVATASMISGLAFAAGGAVLILAGAPADPSVAITAGPTGAGFHARF